jgi:diguanylate cyclase (GGDEF) domain
MQLLRVCKKFTSISTGGCCGDVFYSLDGRYALALNNGGGTSLGCAILRVVAAPTRIYSSRSCTQGHLWGVGMDIGTIFMTVSFMMLINGSVLIEFYRDMPRTLRPAMQYWQAGTALIAGGCAIFAFGAPLPRAFILVAAYGLITFGLTAYLAAVQAFDGIRPKIWQFIPSAALVPSILWFTLIADIFGARLVFLTAVWGWLAFACLSSLLHGSPQPVPISRKILIWLFATVFCYLVIQLGFYSRTDANLSFASEAVEYWFNLLGPTVLSLLPIVGTTTFLLMCSDKLRQRLEEMASTDYLTGLFNRRILADYGARCIEVVAKSGRGFALALLDIDNFKSINDTYGHEVGDQVLAELARCLREHAGMDAILARVGGEEFALLLPDGDQKSAIAMTERLRQAVEKFEFQSSQGAIPVTFSAGIATWRHGDSEFDDVFRRADQALYTAKSSGRNRVEVARLSVAV